MNALREITTRGIKAEVDDGKVKLSGLLSLPPGERERILTIARQNKQQIISILRWGDHAPLAEWFLSTRDTLPVEPFEYWRGGRCSVHWMTPVASYQRLAEAIEEGPEGQHAPEVRSILEQLHHLFSEVKP